MVNLSPLSAFDYFHPFTFDKEAFKSACRREFSLDRRYTDNSQEALLRLLTFIEEDPHVTDIRWMAYMLATVYHETALPIREQVRVLTKKGLPLNDRKGHPVVRSVKSMQVTMHPVSEAGRGRGRQYYAPVKVKKLAHGQAQIIEQDGNRFVVSPSGAVKSHRPAKAAQGTVPGAASIKAYDDDDGEELSYFGRGYVQLTWWSGYASAGRAVGRGLDLLFNPELAKEPPIAYAVMSYGMRTGECFANGRTFSKYFHGPTTNYVKARAMVNGSDMADVIAELARRFERALLISKATRW